MAVLGNHLDVADPRNDNCFLRLSWHAPKHLVVISQWRDGVCVSSTPVSIANVGQIVTFLVGALSDAASRSIPSAVRYVPERAGYLERLRSWWDSQAVGAAVVGAGPRRAERPLSAADELVGALRRLAGLTDRYLRPRPGRRGARPLRVDETTLTTRAIPDGVPAENAASSSVEA